MSSPLIHLQTLLCHRVSDIGTDGIRWLVAIQPLPVDDFAQFWSTEIAAGPLLWNEL